MVQALTHCRAGLAPPLASPTNAARPILDAADPRTPVTARPALRRDSGASPARASPYALSESQFHVQASPWSGQGVARPRYSSERYYSERPFPRSAARGTCTPLSLSWRLDMAPRAPPTASPDDWRGHSDSRPRTRRGGVTGSG